LTQDAIMIVDDNPVNLALLENMLQEKGHEVSLFQLGRLALAAAFRNPPDLILLDINMPEMNGYEVCERLKSTPELSDIPVIFLSALSETQDKVAAFRSGAVDYISKPFQFEEVHARVETHLKVHALEKKLRQQNEKLEETVAVRTGELAESNERLRILNRSKDELLHLISHEFRTPVNGLIVVGEIILEGMLPSEQNDELRGMFEESRRRIRSILDDALLLARLDVNGDAFRSVPLRLSPALNCAIARTEVLARSRQVTVTLPPSGSDYVLAEEELLVRALHSLLVTAIQFSEKGMTVQLSTEVVADSLLVTIECEGKTLAAPALAKFFDLFPVLEAGASRPAGGFGLGPSVASRILPLFGASVSVANRDRSGIRLIVSLKLLHRTAPN